MVLAPDGDSGLSSDGLRASDGAFLSPGPSHLVFSTASSPGGQEEEKAINEWIYTYIKKNSLNIMNKD